MLLRLFLVRLPCLHILFRLSYSCSWSGLLFVFCFCFCYFQFWSVHNVFLVVRCVLFLIWRCVLLICVVDIIRSFWWCLLLSVGWIPIYHFTFLWPINLNSVELLLFVFIVAVVDVDGCENAVELSCHFTVNVDVEVYASWRCIMYNYPMLLMLSLFFSLPKWIPPAYVTTTVFVIVYFHYCYVHMLRCCCRWFW
jgi:hypothetical protein